MNEVLQVDLGTDERTYMDNVVQWEQRIFQFETILKRNVARHRQESHHHGEVKMSNATVRAAIEALLAVGRKWEPDHSGPAPVDINRTHLLVNAQTLTRCATVRDPLKSILLPSPARVRSDRDPGGQWSRRTRVQ